MKRVATAVVLIPLVLALVFRGPFWLFAAFIALIGLISLHEYLGLVERHGFPPQRIVAFALVALLYGGCAVIYGDVPAWFSDLGVFLVPSAVLLAAILALGLALQSKDLRDALPSAASSVLAMLYLGIPLVALTFIRGTPWGKFLLFYLLLVVWAGDTFAYYFGRAFGRRKLAPRISPGKTWEGTAASLLGSIVVGTLIFAYAPSITGFLLRIRLLTPADASPSPAVLSPPIGIAVLLTAAINIAAQLGDLAESALKRGAGVKDSGTLLPGHGGMLDRIDALLFAAPVLWYYALIAGLSGLYT